MLRTVANGLWILLSAAEALRWRRATHHVEQTQRAVLQRILRRNRATQYAIRNTRIPIKSADQFRAHFPLTTYADYVPFVERIAAGETNVLTAEPVCLLEPTSGSTGGTKLIPYTDALKQEFQRGLAAWVVHSFLREPGLWGGQAYWSVTPVTARNRRSSGGIPIGFEEESEYFGGIEGRLIDTVMAVPSAVKLIEDVESFRYVTLLFLLHSRSLALISVWNPTFLSLLLQPLSEWAPQLAEDVATGRLTPPARLDADLRRTLAARNQPDPRRASEIRAIVEAHECAPARHRRLWPHLRLISCWADANAAPYARRLARLFPQARLQPKGLLATEGFVSFPLDGQPGHALSLRSHFYEFMPVKDNGDTIPSTLLAHELEMGKRYGVVITTGGGLYRYRLGDVVEVVGFYNQCPLIRFVGRADAVSDWFGEKLHEVHVQEVLQRVFAEHHCTPAFAMLACDDQRQPPAYVLYIQSEHNDRELIAVAADVEAALQQNVHYAYCRHLGQLDALRVFRVRGDAWQTYIATAVARGQRAGDVKPVALDRRGGWTQIFPGQWLT